jgi:glycosyltransferase involved in cell wall biosynthesis
MRKGFAEQFGAFARFAAHEPAAMLLIHAMASPPGGLNLGQMAEDFDIGERVIFSGQYEQVTGTYTDQEMAAWFSALDVLSACSYGEGFGVPVVEAQACGTPVITTAGTATDELVHRGWRVKGSRFWNPVHRAWWTRPDEDAIYRAYRSARAIAESRRGLAVAHVAPYEFERVKADIWPGVLDDIEAGA